MSRRSEKWTDVFLSSRLPDNRNNELSQLRHVVHYYIFDSTGITTESRKEAIIVDFSNTR